MRNDFMAMKDRERGESPAVVAARYDMSLEDLAELSDEWRARRPSQRKAVARIYETVQALITRDERTAKSVGSAPMELKEFSIEVSTTGRMYVYSEIGCSDEVPWGWIGHRARHIAVGLSGGMTLLNAGRWTGKQIVAAAHVTGLRALTELTK